MLEAFRLGKTRPRLSRISSDWPFPYWTKVIDAGGDRACDGALPVGGVAAHHQSTDCSAAEAQHREEYAGAADLIVVALGYHPDFT
jgi:hypothetical protein